MKTLLNISFLAVLGFAHAAPSTIMASLNSGGSQANARSTGASISGNGNVIVFSSLADNLAANDTNGFDDIYYRNLVGGATERLTLGVGGAQPNGSCDNPHTSYNGRYTVFQSGANNLVPGDSNGRIDIFYHDRLTNTTKMVSMTELNGLGDNNCRDPKVTPDGRYVVFASASTNLVSPDVNGPIFDIYMRDMWTGNLTRVSRTGSGAQLTQTSVRPAISADGRYVTWESLGQFEPTDGNASWDVIRRDLWTGETYNASVSNLGALASPSTAGSFDATISHDGRYVAFTSGADNLVNSDNNGVNDVFVRDMVDRTTRRVSRSTAGIAGNAGSEDAWISADGNFVALRSLANNLVPSDTNTAEDVFVKNLITNEMTRVSESTFGGQGNQFSLAPSVSNDGQRVAFESAANTLTPPDINGAVDIFGHERAGYTRVQGNVDLRNFSGPRLPSMVYFELIPAAGGDPIKLPPVVLAANGDYGFETWVTGDYFLAAKAQTWLRRIRNSSMTLNGTTLVNANLILINGDVNGDNIVDIADYAHLATNFDKSSSDANWGQPNVNGLQPMFADLNGDEIVDIADYAILAASFDSVGE